ncbi:MAG: porphobilinogen synthase [Candidatus Bathyarchaeota archaeon]|nr:porphobilinogen synthase [Candidatus Bathyarchaeota archaeon]
MSVTTRIKKSKQMLRLVRPFELSTNDLVFPIFVREDAQTLEVPSMKGQRYLSLDEAVKTCQKAVDAGIPGVMVFGVINHKDEDGSVALQKDGFHAQVFRRLKSEFDQNLVLISNVCMCDFTREEFCVYSKNGKVLHEKTAQMLAKIAVAHAEAGADLIAPAAMADGQVLQIRAALDAGGFDDVAVMSYIKTDSCLFQPFYQTMTQSAGTARAGIDSSKFRIDIINEKMFIQKANLEISQGADIIIVKPALTNLDLILRMKQQFPTVPIAAYQVSGEYAMIKTTAEKGLLNEDRLLMETLNSIKRAGADMILTYHGLEAAALLNR